MPTPGGKLKKGDRLWHDSEPGVIFRVVEREGNDAVYSVIIEREDQRVLPATISTRNPHNLKQMRLLEAHYWVFMHQGGWHLVDPAR